MTSAPHPKCSVANPKTQNFVDFSDVKQKPLHTALKPTLWLLFQYITACQIQLVSVYGPVVHTDHNFMTSCGQLAASKVQKVIDLQVKL